MLMEKYASPCFIWCKLVFLREVTFGICSHSTAHRIHGTLGSVGSISDDLTSYTSLHSVYAPPDQRVARFQNDGIG